MGLNEPKSEFGPLRPMSILMRYGGKFSTILLAQDGGEARRSHTYSLGPQTPRPSSPSLATSRAKIRVPSTREVEVPLDLPVLVLLVHLLVLVLVHLVEVV